MKRTITSLAILYVLLLAGFTAAIVAVHHIPRSAIEANLRRSVVTLVAEGTEKHVFTPEDAKLGNFTDCYMANVAYCANDSLPVRAALMAMRHRNLLDMPADTQGLIDGTVEPQLTSYGKYWHGYMLLYRPLLVFTDYQGMRMLNIILMATLTLIMLVLLWKRLSPAAALCMTISLYMMRFTAVPLSLCFSPCFIIMMVSMVLILTVGRLTRTLHAQILTFFAIGAFTAYFDFFTTPIITLGVPLIILMLYRMPERSMKTIVLLSAAWAVGYAGLWVSKWLITYLLLNYDLTASVTGGLVQHSPANTATSQTEIWIDIVKRWIYPNFHNIEKYVIFGIAGLMVWMSGIRKGQWRQSIWLLVVGCIVLVWQEATINHVYSHGHCTHRDYLVMWLAALLYLSQFIHVSKIKNHVQHLIKR
ncbi:MAG: hypothetical protein IJ808_00205 [Muribaculaceae bacterium]|nr:hypothetical protein [Muribaculaceae bacterium]